MIKNITIGQYIPGQSLLHRADPRIKIILMIIYMVDLFAIVNSYYTYAAFLMFTLLVIVSSDIPVSYTLRGIKPVLFIVVFTAIINIFTTEGTPILEAGFMRITYEGLDMAVKMAIRLSLMVIGGSLLTLTTTPIMLTDGIEKLISPLKIFKVPVHEIAMMMTIALRFIPTLMDETEKIMKAQSARGADFDSGSLMQRAKSFIPVLVPLFISAFRRADDLATAMEARCYRGSAGRTRMRQLHLGFPDFVLMSVMLIFTAGLIFLEYYL